MKTRVSPSVDRFKLRQDRIPPGSVVNTVYRSRACLVHQPPYVHVVKIVLYKHPAMQAQLPLLGNSAPFKLVSLVVQLLLPRAKLFSSG
jgi:hypothetical protein